MDVKYPYCFPLVTNNNKEDNLMAVPSPSTPPVNSFSSDISRFHTVVRCSDALSEPDNEPAHAKPFLCIRSGSYAEIGTRRTIEDEHIRIDDFAFHLRSAFKWPSSFYTAFDGHGGCAAASYIKRNAMRIFFEDAGFPLTSAVNAVFMEELVNCHQKAFLWGDIALAAESSVSSTCGTTALSALVVGRHY